MFYIANWLTVFFKKVCAMIHFIKKNILTGYQTHDFSFPVIMTSVCHVIRSDYLIQCHQYKLFPQIYHSSTTMEVNSPSITKPVIKVF